MSDAAAGLFLGATVGVCIGMGIMSLAFEYLPWIR
jgi:hypothetical protein